MTSYSVRRADADPVPEHAELVGSGKPAANRSTWHWIGILLLLVLLSEEVAYAFNLVTPACLRWR